MIRFGYGLNEQSNQGRAAKVFADAADKASGGKMKVRAIGDKIRNKLQDKGLVGLVYWENGFRNLTNSTRAIPMAFSELFSALETKTVDGQENPFNTILSSKFYEVQKYMTVTNHVYSPWIVTASKKWWDQLSKDEQKVLMDAATASRLTNGASVHRPTAAHHYGVRKATTAS